MMCIIDVYDRAIVDYHIGLSCEGKHATQILQRALWKRQLFKANCRPVIRSDNGPQFISNHFETAGNQLSIELIRIPPKTPNKNAHIESFHAILEDNCLSRHEFSSYQEACQTVINYIQFYNERRIHGSLYDYAPFEFRKLLAGLPNKSLYRKSIAHSLMIPDAGAWPLLNNYLQPSGFDLDDNRLRLGLDPP